MNVFVVNTYNTGWFHNSLTPFGGWKPEMKTVTLEQALDLGLKPCPSCFKDTCPHCYK